MEKLFARQIDAAWLTLAVAAVLALAANTRFWSALADASGGMYGARPLLLLGVFLIIVLVFNACLTLVSFRPTAKPVLVGLLLTAAAASHFIARYGIVIDRGMIQSVFETDAHEAVELLNWRLVADIGVLGVLPSLLIWRVRLRFPAGWRGVLRRVALGGGSLALAVLLLMLLFKDLAPVLREHRELRYLLVPTNVFQAIHGHLRGRFAAPVVVKPLGRDAVKGRAWLGQHRRTVTVLVVGETARAASFSLNGYARQTNPQLSREPGLINFTHVSSCGTATAVSLPCVFSSLGRGAYSQSRAESQEGLLDVLKHAGFEVVWRDNNSGCKGVCKRVRFEDLNDCGAAVECYDERLVLGLPELIRTTQRDLVVVLHQKGSHGPAYAQRYPAGFGKFGPVCASGRFDACTRASIAAAYDNTILYTDYVLSKLIDVLRQQTRDQDIDTAMLYFSDHGESLGENNMYLHGAPYFMAPEEQTRVPMMAWLSEGFTDRFGIDRNCLLARRDQSFSHDNIFHSVLGMLDVNTAVLNPGLDIFHACRTHA